MISFKNFYVADFETITAETKYFKKYNRTGIVYGYIESLTNERHNRDFIDIGDMLKWLTDKRISSVVYFHNLSFDGVFILDYLGRNGYTLTNEIDNESQFSVFRTTGSKIYKIVLSFKWRGKLKFITFLCSKLLLSSSVEALGKNSNIAKFEDENVDKEKFYCREPAETLREFYCNNRDYCEYCKRDVKIVINALKDFLHSVQDFLIEIGEKDAISNVLETFTISAMSFKIQKLMLKKHGLTEDDIHLHKLTHRIYMDKFTNGGLTVNNLMYQNKELKNVVGYVIDLKSAYPAVMSGELPYGRMLYEKPDGNHCEFQEIYYEDIWPKNHSIPLLKNWLPGEIQANYFLAAKQYTTYLLKEEVDELEKLYNFTGKKIIRSVYFRTKEYLNEFVTKMFNYKEHYKKIGELGKSHTFKIFLNSAYGIHAKRFDFKLVVPFSAEDSFEKNGIQYVINERIDLNNPSRHSYIPNNKLSCYNPIVDENDDIEVSTTHKAVANFITAKTRIKLLKGIQHFKPKNFVYCDTDSLFLINVKKEDILKYCGNKLGDWELEEKVFDTGYFIRPKLYEISEHNKIQKQGTAGFKKNVVKIPHLLNQEKIEVLNASLIPVRVEGGIILMNMKKFLKNDKLPFLTNYQTDESFKDTWKKYLKMNEDKVDKLELWVTKKQ